MDYVLKVSFISVVFFLNKISPFVRKVSYNYWGSVIQFLESLKPLFPLAINMILRFILMTAKSAEVLFCFVLNDC